MTPLTSERRRSRGRRRWLPVVLVAVALWSIAVLGIAVIARHYLVRGRDTVETMRRETDPAALADGKPLGPLRQASADFERAHGLLRNPVLLPVRWMPVLARQLRAVTAMSSAADHVTEVAAEGITAARVLVEKSHGTGPERVTLLRDAAGVAGRSRQRLRGAARRPGRRRPH